MDESTIEPKAIGSMNEGDLRRLIREEMSAQMKDVPNRADVDRMIEQKIRSAENKASVLVAESETRTNNAIHAMDGKISSLQTRIDGIGENLRTLADLVKSIDQKISDGQKSMDARMQAVAAAQVVLDGRLDALEPKLKANSEAIFGTSDGVAGLRGQVNTMALNMGTMREGLNDINRWMARHDAHALQRQQQIERVFSFANSWYVRLGVVVVVASLLDQTVGDLVKLIGGF